MRGKQFGMNPNVRSKRITPADAGKTQIRAIHNNFTEDHPRGCGENLYVQMMRCNFKGSPPRMRGKLGLPSKLSVLFRITPADAGKTRIADMGRRNSWDHPRGCGEN